MVRVFIADDSTPIRERIIKMLTSVPDVKVVGEAIDGAEAIVKIREKKPDLVILDLQMPKISGLEFLPVLKAMDPSPRILVLTNFSSKYIRKACASMGADYLFDKSTEFDEAIEMIKKWCNVRPVLELQQFLPTRKYTAF